MKALIEVIRDFTQAITNPYDLDDLLDRLTSQAALLLEATGAGIMLQTPDGGLGFAAAWGGSAVTEVERQQDRVQAGACYEAFSAGTIIAVADLAESDRWPTYSAKAVDLGLSSVLGVPMSAHGQTIGVLNVYRSTPGPWSDGDVAAAEIMAALGAGYILHAGQLSATQEFAEQLQQALESRAVIERAKGVLMAKHDLSADTAFAWLRKWSMDRNVRLRDVARDVVDRHDRY